MQIANNKFGCALTLRRGACAVRWCGGLRRWGADTCSLCTVASPCISCAPQPSPSRHSRSRSKDAEAVQVNSALASMTNFIAKYFSHWMCRRIYNLSRGRVGRSGREGFTYLFYTDKSSLSRIAMGALDGGLDIPHSDKRLAGFKKDKKQLGAEIHRKYIYEGHVADYMKRGTNPATRAKDQGGSKPSPPLPYNQVIIGWEQKGEQAMTLFKFGFDKESRQ
ncbi:uncharacterized protein [Triticum aestivum]|uniref:uncharacterized protein n=1 Tax=Triticum aestivum TaxID=4565 RepID=UPI001D022FB5|nr:uncharacterized protein LOC123098736 [Triticum aestivum]